MVGMLPTGMVIPPARRPGAVSFIRARPSSSQSRSGMRLASVKATTGVVAASMPMLRPRGSPTCSRQLIRRAKSTAATISAIASSTHRRTHQLEALGGKRLSPERLQQRRQLAGGVPCVDDDRDLRRGDATGRTGRRGSRHAVYGVRVGRVSTHRDVRQNPAQGSLSARTYASQPPVRPGHAWERGCSTLVPPTTTL